MAIEVRNAQSRDIPAILNIVNQAILHTTAIYDYDARTLQQQLQWFEEKQNAGHPVIVAVADGAVVGFGTYGVFRIKVAYKYTIEHSVYVAEGFVGRGIGKLLLQSLIDRARAEGYHTMIGCIDAENSGSITFHEKFGFTRSGEIMQVGYKFDRWLDLVIMQLILKDAVTP
jgi:L-amino acid N-acyltransferase YncA